MRPFYAAAALWLTSPTANKNHLVSGLDYWPISGLVTNFSEGKEDFRNLHSSDWYTLWAFDLRDRVKDILSVLETRPVRVEASSPELTVDTSGSFSVAMVGDSTMRMQAQGLFSLLANMTTADGKEQCRCTSLAHPCICFKDGDGGSNVTAILRFEYHKVWEPCVDSDIVADFVYFGCGLHILHRHPSRPIDEDILQRWTQYEKILDEAVQAYRSSGTLRSGYLGEAFMTTHSIILERLEDPMLGDILKFVNRNESILAECYEKVTEIEVSLKQSELGAPAKDICTRGYFADECVVDINKRGKAVMKRLNVPIVPSYEITLSQDWATNERDGRHYPVLVPQELAQFLGIIGTALKEEKLMSTL